MAIIWAKQEQGTHYKVTQAGHSLRLYRNQVLHSQWNPKDPIKGNIWELFLLSSLVTQEKISRALILGSGGGAVVKLLHYYFPHAVIDAIDLDPVHLSISKRFFKVNVERCHLICADAKQWLAQSNRMKYDLIIDDLFAEQDGVPMRAVNADVDWVNHLLARLSNQGSLVMNFADKREWNHARKLIKKSVHDYALISAKHRYCDNRIIFFSPQNSLMSRAQNVIQAHIPSIYAKHWRDGVFSLRRVRF